METLKEKAYEYQLNKKGRGLLSTQIKSSSDIYKFVKKLYGGDMGVYESSFIVCLNRANKIISWVKLSQGGIDYCVLDRRLAAKIAIDSLATSVILVHNHPSGNCYPSEQDKRATNDISAGLKLFDISLLDHLIITEEKYFSMVDEQLI